MRLLRTLTVFAVVAASLPASPLAAQVTLPTLPTPRGFSESAAEVIVDGAGVLDPASAARINAIAWRVWAGSRGEIAVATLPSLEGRGVEEVALNIARAWGLGSKAGVGDRARNAGTLVLLVPRASGGGERGRIRIEVGQGAEGFITDAISGDIIREATPLLGRGEYGPGLSLITARLAQRYAAAFEFSLDSTLVPPQTRGRRSSERFPAALFVIVFVLFVILSSRRRGSRSRNIGLADVIIPILFNGRSGGGWGGGGFGGGGFGGFGGGGGFSGGGSSGSF